MSARNGRNPGARKNALRSDPTVDPFATTARRWIDRIEPTDDDHWPWPGQMAPDGSPLCQIGVNGKRVSYRARRLMWEVLVGPIPPGHVLRMVCEEPGCVNP